MELSLNSQSAEALRDFSSEMPKAVQNIQEATDVMKRVYVSLEEECGEHASEFGSIFGAACTSVEKAQEPINVLAPRLRDVADQIDAYVAQKPEL